MDFEIKTMRRYIFYILVALLTFGIGSFLALKLFLNFNPNTSASPEFLSSLSSNPVLETTFPKLTNSSFKKEEIPAKPFCNDKNILSVWQFLLKDRYFREWPQDLNASLDCKDMLEIKQIDLNEDGNKEILLRGKNLCSAVGNCPYWIYQKQGKSYQKLLSDTDYIDVSKLGEQMLKTKSNGYHDILLKGHLSASDTSYAFYKFDGKKYRLNKNLVKACIICVGDNPKWKFMTLREYWNSKR